MSSSQKKYPQNLKEFQDLVSEIKSSVNYKDPLLFAIGRHVRANKGSGELVSVRYPFVNGPGMNTGTAAILMKVLEIQPTGVKNIFLSYGTLQEILRYFKIFENDGKEHENISVLKMIDVDSIIYTQGIVVSFIFEDIEPQGIDDSTLKLYGVSNRFFKPNEINLNNILTKFPTVAWIGDNPLGTDGVKEFLLLAAFTDMPHVPLRIDKLPLYIHRINALELGVCITNPHTARLGDYIEADKTIMHIQY